MTTFLLAAAVLVVFVLLVLKPKLGSGPEIVDAKFPYKSLGPLLTKAERSFYGSLVRAVGENAIVFAKVRVADVLSPEKGLDRSTWQRAFNAISAKHLDFVLCDPDDLKVLAGVELDDSSHDSKKAQDRDTFVNVACESAKLPLIRVKASRGYVVAELRQQVMTAIGKAPVVEAPPVQLPEPAAETDAAPVEAVAEVDAPTVEAIEPAPAESSETPVCPKCGAEMVRRVAKSGDNAGNEFWGCSSFPKCRSMLPVVAQVATEGSDTPS